MYVSMDHHHHHQQQSPLSPTHLPPPPPNHKQKHKKKHTSNVPTADDAQVFDTLASGLAAAGVSPQELPPNARRWYNVCAQFVPATRATWVSQL